MRLTTGHPDASPMRPSVVSSSTAPRGRKVAAQGAAGQPSEDHPSVGMKLVAQVQDFQAER